MVINKLMYFNGRPDFLNYKVALLALKHDIVTQGLTIWQNLGYGIHKAIKMNIYL